MLWFLLWYGYVLLLGVIDSFREELVASLQGQLVFRDMQSQSEVLSRQAIFDFVLHSLQRGPYSGEASPCVQPGAVVSSLGSM